MGEREIGLVFEGRGELMGYLFNNIFRDGVSRTSTTL